MSGNRFKNVFILSTGRAGSTTFYKACQHIDNYSCGHQSQIHITGADRVLYQDYHIESDPFLHWFLGRLDNHYGKEAFYVFLRRDRKATVQSFTRRYYQPVMKAFREGILYGNPLGYEPSVVVCDYLDMVEENILFFLKDKPNKITIRLEEIYRDFPEFWDRIGALGDKDAAMAEWQNAQNAGPPLNQPIHWRIFAKMKRVIQQLPQFLREV